MTTVRTLGAGLGIAVCLSGLGGCSLLAPKAACDGPQEVQQLSGTLIESGAVGSVVLAASYGNSQLKAGLGLIASAVGIGGNALEAAATTLKAIAKAGPAALQVQGTTATGDAPAGTLVCRADVHLATAPPAGVLGAGTWALATQSHWTVLYTAAIDAGTRKPVVTVTSTTCEGPGCKAAADLTDTARDLQGAYGDQVLSGTATGKGSSAGSPAGGDGTRK